MAANTYLSTSLEKAKQRFATFQEVRRNYDALLERNSKTELQPELEDVGEGIDYQTPDIEKALGDYEDVLKMNPTSFDVLPWHQNVQTAKDSRDILYWLARGWEYENKGRWWDRAVAEGQTRYGFKVMRHCWRPVTSEDVDADAQTPKEVLEVHEKAQKHRKHPFYWEDCDVYNCYWVGDEQGEYGADIFFYQYKLPYLEAQDRFSRDDEKFSLNEKGQVAWLGASEDTDSDSWADKEMTVTVVDCRDLKNRKCRLPECAHKQRVIRIYVAENDDQCLDDENLVSEQDSPFPNCSFYVIGGRISSKSDPNLRFRPLMHALYVEGQWTNYLTTLQAVEVRADYGDNGLYVDYSQARPELLTQEDNSQVKSFEFGPQKEGTVQGLPGELKRPPRNISPHLPTLRAEHQERLQRYLPNRFMVGEAAKEASNATGSAFLQQAQQAALPFNTLLGESDKAIEQRCASEIHAVKWWPGDERWYVVMTGAMQQVKTKSSVPARGTVAWVDADKLNMDFDVVIRTRSVTDAEKGAEWNIAQSQYREGAITPEKLIRATGEDDIEGVNVALADAWMDSFMAPQLQTLLTYLGYRLFYGRTGFDMQNLAQLGQTLQAQAQPPGRPNTPTQPANNTFGRSAPQPVQQPTINLPPGTGSVSGGSSPVQ